MSKVRTRVESSVNVEGGLRGPLVELLKRGEVPHDVRLMAARGELAPRADEQMQLLVLLASDSDPEVAAAAETTLASIAPDVLRAHLARNDVPAEVRAFCASRGIEPSAEGVPLPDGDGPVVGGEAESRPPETAEPQGIVLRIAGLTVAQKVALAMKGSREERTVLVRDPNKLVGVAVLSSPKLTDSEVESIARMASVSDDVLRVIAGNRAWMKRYGVVLALARNPKTPVTIAMNLLSRLAERDLRALSTDRNVAEAVRISARQRVVLQKK